MSGQFLLVKDFPSLDFIKQQVEGYPAIDAEAIFTLNALLDTTRVVENEIDRGLAQYDLSHGRHVALWCVAVLGGEEGITPAHIADQLGVTRATVTGLLDSLEQAGLVSRTRDLEDRRKVSIRLTPAGNRKIEQVWPVHYGLVTLWMTALSKAEKVQLRTLLQKIRGKASILSNDELAQKVKARGPVAKTGKSTAKKAPRKRS
ncbi:MAG: MarR family transcriptional regulator [Parvibaculum sp.]